jgi:hypothetical protein
MKGKVRNNKKKERKKRKGNKWEYIRDYRKLLNKELPKL